MNNYNLSTEMLFRSALFLHGVTSVRAVAAGANTEEHHDHHEPFLPLIGHAGHGSGHGSDTGSGHGSDTRGDASPGSSRSATSRNSRAERHAAAAEGRTQRKAGAKGSGAKGSAANHSGGNGGNVTAIPGARVPAAPGAGSSGGDVGAGNSEVVPGPGVPVPDSVRCRRIRVSVVPLSLEQLHFLAGCFDLVDALEDLENLQLRVAIERSMKDGEDSRAAGAGAGHGEGNGEGHTEAVRHGNHTDGDSSDRSPRPRNFGEGLFDFRWRDFWSQGSRSESGSGNGDNGGTPGIATGNATNNQAAGRDAPAKAPAKADPKAPAKADAKAAGTAGSALALAGLTASFLGINRPELDKNATPKTRTGYAMTASSHHSVSIAAVIAIGVASFFFVLLIVAAAVACHNSRVHDAQHSQAAEAANAANAVRAEAGAETRRTTKQYGLPQTRTNAYKSGYHVGYDQALLEHRGQPVIYGDRGYGQGYGQGYGGNAYGNGGNPYAQGGNGGNAQGTWLVAVPAEQAAAPQPAPRPAPQNAHNEQGYAAAPETRAQSGPSSGKRTRKSKSAAAAAVEGHAITYRMQNGNTITIVP